VLVDELPRCGDERRTEARVPIVNPRGAMIAPSTPPLAQLVDAIEQLVCGLTLGGEIVFANQRSLELARLPREEVIGADWRQLFASEERHDQLAAQWAEISPGRPSRPFESLSRSGKRLRWQFSSWSLDGRPGVCAVGTDVTDERDAQARSRSVERVSAVSNLGAGLAHELRNPLNSAHLQLVLLSRKIAKLGAASMLGPHVEAAKREIARTAEILDDFLVFARPQRHALERVELSAVVRRAVARVQARADDAGVAVEVVASPPLAAELAAVRVEDAIHHLVANAIDACRTVRAPAVTVRARLEGNVAIVEVEDNGPGLPVDAPVFDPFFTTKPSGTGLGLAIVERVAIDHGGGVEFERAGNVTVFRLKLPIMCGALPRG
jgi:PAS domain S-box-containing protein